MRTIVWMLVVALVVLHQDNWFWGDTTLVMGFLPIGLAYHAGISLAAGITWYLAARYCWPDPADRLPAADRRGGADLP